MEPLTIAALGMTALGVVNSAVDMFSSPTTLPEPQMSKEALSILQAQLAQAGSGQGLPQQIVSGAERRLSTQAAQIVAEGLSTGRQSSVLASPLLFDVLAEKALSKSTEFRQTGLERIEALDVEAYMKDLERRSAIAGQIAQLSGQIDTANAQRAIYEEKMEQAKVQNFANMIGTGVQNIGLMSYYSAAGSGAAGATAQSGTAAVPTPTSAPIVAPVAPSPSAVPSLGLTEPGYSLGSIGMMSAEEMLAEGYDSDSYIMNALGLGGSR